MFYFFVLRKSKWLFNHHLTKIIDDLNFSITNKTKCRKVADNTFCKFNYLTGYNKHRKEFQLAYGVSNFLLIKYHYCKCSAHGKIFNLVTDSNLLENILPPENNRKFYCFDSNHYHSPNYQCTPSRYYWWDSHVIKTLWNNFWKKPSVVQIRKLLIDRYKAVYMSYKTDNNEEYIESDIEDELSKILPGITYMRNAFVPLFTYFLESKKYRMFELISRIPLTEFGWDWTWWPDKLKSRKKISGKKSKFCKIKASCGYLIAGNGFIVSCIPLFGDDESNLQVAKLLVPVLVRNWMYCDSKLYLKYLLCTDNVKKQWYVRYTIIPYLILYLKKYFQANIIEEKIFYHKNNGIDINVDKTLKDGKFIFKFNEYTYDLAEIEFYLALDPAHWGRRIYTKLSKRNAVTYIHKQNINFVFRSATITRKIIDVSDYFYGLTWYETMKNKLNDDDVCILQFVCLNLMVRENLYYNKDSKNISEAVIKLNNKKIEMVKKELDYNLFSNREYYQYLIDIINWICNYVPKCMQLYAFSIFRCDITLVQWKYKTINYKVIYNDEEKIIKVPAFSTPYCFYRYLVQNIAMNSNRLIVTDSYQDIRMLQIAVLALFEFCFIIILYFIFFFYYFLFYTF